MIWKSNFGGRIGHLQNGPKTQAITLKIVKLFQQNLVHHPLIVGCTVWEPQNIRNFAESGFFSSGAQHSYKHIRTKKKRFFPEKALFSICFDSICFWIESTVSVHSFDVTTFPFIPKTDSFKATINLLDNQGIYATRNIFVLQNAKNLKKKCQPLFPRASFFVKKECNICQCFGEFQLKTLRNSRDIATSFKKKCFTFRMSFQNLTNG